MKTIILKKLTTPVVDGVVKGVKAVWSCDVDPDSVVPKGTKIGIKFIWGFMDDQPSSSGAGMTEPVDIFITLRDDTPIRECLVDLESMCLACLNELGASELRYYFIEDVSWDNATESLVFSWGT